MQRVSILSLSVHSFLVISGPTALNHFEYPAAFAMATWVSSNQAGGGEKEKKGRFIFDNLLVRTTLSSKRVILKLKAPQGELREEFVDFSFAFLYPPAIKFPTFFPWRVDIRRF